MQEKKPCIGASVSGALSCDMFPSTDLKVEGSISGCTELHVFHNQINGHEY